MRAPNSVTAGALALGLALLCACAEEREAAPPSVVPIVTSVQPLAFLVDELAGDAARVTAMVPPGASPHAFEPLPGDVARLAGARYFVRVGGGFDDWAQGLADAAPDSLETLVVLDLPGVPAETGDPHAWLDPILVRDVIVPAIRERLVAANPEGEPHYRAREREFAERLTALDDEIRDTLSRAAGNRYVAFHPAWRRFARRYGLEELAVVQEAPGEEPTPKQLAALVVAARGSGVPAILVEPQLDPRVAEVIAAEFGGTTVIVDPLGDPADPARDSYEDLMRFNASAMARAVGGDGA